MQVLKEAESLLSKSLGDCVKYVARTIWVCSEDVSYSAIMSEVKNLLGGR